MKKPQVNEDVIKVYKFILLERLRNRDGWKLDGGDLECPPMKNVSNLFFEINKNSEGKFIIGIKSEYSTKFTFILGTFDFKIRKEIIKCTEYIKHKKELDEVKSIEGFLMDSLDDQIKRRIKIEKIRKKI